MFQAFNLIPTLTAEDNILLPLLAAGRKDSGNGQLEKLLARLDLAERRRHRPDALSGGEQQRVAIARALVADPSIILADEPTGSLDSVSGQSICRLLQELCQEQGRTIVVVTHEPAVAIWAERIVVLKDGRVLTEFKTAEYPRFTLAGRALSGYRRYGERGGGESMRIIWKMVLAQAWRHPARMILTSLAMIASACVVVWVVSGYDAIVSQFGNKASEYLGRYDLFLVPDSLEESFVSPELIEKLRKDSAIAELEPVLQSTVRIQTDKPIEMGMGGPPGRGMAGSGRDGPAGRGGQARRGPGMGGPPSGRAPGTGGPPGGGRMAGGPPRGMFFNAPKLVGTNANTPPYELIEGRWIDHRDPELREAVISNQSAEQMEVGLGEEVLVISGTKEYRLKIVGIVAQASSPPTIQKKSPTGRPMMTGPGATLGPAASALYVPMPLAEKITRQGGGDSSTATPTKVNLVNIKLREGASAAEFRTQWLPQAAQAKPSVLLIGAGDLKQRDGRRHDGRQRQKTGVGGHRYVALGRFVHHFHHAEHGRA